MATPSQARAVKSLNMSGGRKRFVFKSFSQRLEEVNVNVFRSLDPIKPEPSDGSSFFRDCLVEWRELNTAEDFISFYEVMLPRIQSLPLVILHKELILTELVSRLTMKARLSLEPILRLIAALSRDLLEDFLVFLPRVVDSLACLLKTGADGEPELLEEIFMSWSVIVMNLQKYMVQDIIHILKITLQLRYYRKDYVQDFMAQTISFLLRNAPVEQLIKGTRKVIGEVARKPTFARKFGVSALLQNTMQGTSMRFHSRAEQVFHLLIDNTMFAIGDKFSQGSDMILEVLDTTFAGLCEHFELSEVNSMWDWFYGVITHRVKDGSLLHMSRILSLLISTVKVNKGRKFFDHRKMCEIVRLLIEIYMLPSSIVDTEHMSVVVDKVLELMLCVLDGLHNTNNLSTICGIASQWAPVFELKSKRLLRFIKEMLMRDPCIPRIFRINILSVLNDSIDSSREEVLCLTLDFCESMKVKSFKFLDGVFEERISRLSNFLQEATNGWIQSINDISYGDHSSIQFCDSELALLWGIISCHSYMPNTEENQSLSMNMVDALDQLLIIFKDKEKIAGHTVHVWQSLTGAALSCYHKLIGDRKPVLEEILKFLRLAKDYKSSLRILVSVADFLDSTESILQEQMKHKLFHPDLTAEKVIEAMQIFAENLSHPNKDIRVSTLRILCHYKYFRCGSCTEDEPDGKQVEIDVPKKCPVDIQFSDALENLHLIEATPLSVSSSRKVILLISKTQTTLTSGRMSDVDITFVLNGIIGVFHNRFSYLWDPASECLSLTLSKYARVVWDRFVYFIEQYQLKFLTAQEERFIKEAKPCQFSGLVDHFNQFVNDAYDSTPCETVLSLLLRCLQKIPDIVESRSRHVITLFLMFLGYDDCNFLSVGSFQSHSCKEKEWKGVLKDWLDILKAMRNLRCSYQSDFLKAVLQNRLLDDNDADIQMKVLDCLLIWKDDFLLPYNRNLKNLVTAQSLRDELARWSISKESNLIEECHRSLLVPFVIRLLMPKVRKPKMLASQKKASVHRKAVLGFIAQLDASELPLFFALLIGPLQVTSKSPGDIVNSLWRSTENSGDDFQMTSFLNDFTMHDILSISWKKRFGFMHVIEDVLGIFDEIRIRPFLDLLLGLVVRVLRSCTLSLQGVTCDGSFLLQNDSSVSQTETENGDLRTSHDMTCTGRKQFKDLRSLCLKIISLVLNKYEDHDFSCGFFDLFIMSVKPLIKSFKQEASSSLKPSALFSCFVAMSQSHKLVSLLCREQNLVPDIFSILTVDTASEDIFLCVFKFIENLLILDDGLDDDEHAIRRILVVNLESLVSNLHGHFLNKTARRKSLNFSGEAKLGIFKLLSKNLKETVLVRKFVEILLQLLTMSARNSDASMEILKVLLEVAPVLGSEIAGNVLNAVCPLFTSAGLDLRLSACAFLGSLGQTDSAVFSLAKFMNELNAISSVEMGELDYDTVLGAYEKTSTQFFCDLRQEHALIILSQFVYDMSSDELILRQSAQRSLSCFIEFSGLVLEQESSTVDELSKPLVTCVDNGWSGNNVLRIINKFVLKHMGEAMSKGSSVHKEWVELFRVMVLKLPELCGLKSFEALCSKDVETDFFNNIIHLQKHRRAKALALFKSVVDAGVLSEFIMSKVFVPLFWSMMLDVQDGKGEHVRNACLDTLASISGHIKWASYYALLSRCLKEMNSKPDKQKLLLRLVCSILDNFHFSTVRLNQGFHGDLIDNSSLGTDEDGSSIVFVEAQNCLHKIVLPKLQKLITSDSEKVNVNANLAALKLLKLLPGNILDSQLTTIIHHISNFLKCRLESIRDEARSALAACLKELGLEYLQFVVSILRATLKRGYELHVLGYTVNFLLSCFLRSCCGKLDYCVGDLLSVAENDLFGDVSEEKEVIKIASKMKETRKTKSFETLKLISQNVTFKSLALSLLSPITAQLKKQLTPKMKSKVQTALSYIASGIEGNPSVDLTDLFIFLYGLIDRGISNEDHLDERISSINTSNSFSSIISAEPQCFHAVTVFALGLLNNRIKNLKMDNKNHDLLSMLDPFIKPLGNCLNSKFLDIVSAATRCLALLIRLPLPALNSEANKIKAALLDIVQSSTNAHSPHCQSSLKLLTVLLRSTRVTLSTEQLLVLVRCPLFLELDRNPSFVALSLLKAIVNRKLIAPEIYDLVTRVAELMVASQVEAIRKKCNQILLQFLLDYQLSAKRLQQHLDFILVNLRYEHSTGREAVLEILHAIIIKFPKNIVDEQSQTFFVHLVVCLANDPDNKIRSMIGVALKHLIGRMSQHSIQCVLEYCQSWYLGSKQQLWSAAAQVLGLLVEVIGSCFKIYITKVLPVMRRILQCAMNLSNDKHLDLSKKAVVPWWKEAYYSLVLWEKLLHQFGDLCFQKEIEDIWEAIIKLLLHPHKWIRDISNRLVAFYFVAVAKSNIRNHQHLSETYFLMRPSRLFLIAASICCQLIAHFSDDATGLFYEKNSPLVENMVFAVSGLHSFMGKIESFDALTFWSTLDPQDHDCFLRGCQLLDLRKGSEVFTSFRSGVYRNNDATISADHRYFLLSYLLRRMGKISLHKDAFQMRFVFSSYKRILVEFDEGACEHYAMEMMLPLYKVCEGFSGKVIADDVKVLAGEVLGELQKRVGTQKFVQLYNQIRKSVKAKRDKRKQEERVIAVTDPSRDAKRKLRIAEKHRIHKKRKIMNLKMGHFMTRTA